MFRIEEEKRRNKRYEQMFCGDINRENRQVQKKKTLWKVNERVK